MKTLFNKLLSLTVAVLVVMASFVPSAKASETDVALVPTAEMITLHNLGIIELTSPDYILTKGDLAKAICNIILPDSPANSSNSPFIDVDSSLTYADAIKHLATMGVIDTSTKYYNPLINATGNDLAQMFVGGVLGYSKITNDVWSLGSAVGAFKNTSISKNSIITMQDFADFLYKNLDTPYLVGYTGEYYKDSSMTVLSTLGFAVCEGSLVSSPEGSVGARVYNETSVIVETASGDILLKLGDVDVSGYLGASGKFYYSENNKNTLVYAEFSDAEFLTIYGKQISSVTNETIKYIDDKDEDEKLNFAGAPVIYNGTMVSSSSMSLYVQPDNGYITVLHEGKEVKSLYVWDYKVGIIDGTDVYSEKILFAKTVYGTNEVSYGNYTDVNVYLNGNPSSTDNLGRNQIAWYAEDKDGKKLTIFASTDNIFWGTYESLGDGYIEINGQKYPYHDNLFTVGGQPDIRLGETAMFYMSPTGEIFHYVPDKYIENNMYGYLLKVSNPQSGLEAGVSFYLINELGQLKEFPLAKKIKYYDGTPGGTYTSVDRDSIRTVSGLFSGGVLVDQLVRYSVNLNNEITMITRYQDLTDPSHPEYEKGFVDNTFTKVLANDSTRNYYMRYDTNGTGKFDNKYIASANCLVFVIKPDLSKGTVSTCSQTFSKKFFDNSQTTGADISIYSADRFMTVSMAVYKTDEDFASSSTQSFVFDCLTVGIDSNGEECTFINGYNGTTYVKYPVSSDYTLPTFSKGDILYVGLTGDYVTSASVLVGANAVPFYKSRYNSGATATDASANMHAARLCFKGTMYGINDARDTIVVNTDYDWDTYRAFSLSAPNVIVFDTARNMLIPSSVAQLPDADYDSPVNIAFVAQSSRVRTIVVYK